ncbi:MAG TPA: nucleotidyltransferase domain-containing protein [Lachnospiraceae bacterium]|nr:nucleotidyltransferase domain-containing protein [Lachnospiraceae bacterium]
MYFPTEKHEEYIEYIKKACNQNCLSLVLEGSLAHGTAKPFSDIDLILYGNINSKILDDIISGYDNIVITNLTENPMGIYILNYENRISVDLDIRKCVLSSEIDNNVILCNYGFKIAEDIKRSVIISRLMPERPQWYRTIRLIHRCCIKFLCGKTDSAKGLADEVCNAVYALTNQNILKSGSIKQRMKDSLQYLNHFYFIDKSIIDLLEELFQEMDYV